MRVFVGAATALLTVSVGAWFASDGVFGFLGGFVALASVAALAAVAVYVLIEGDPAARAPRASVIQIREYRRMPNVTYLAQRRCGTCSRLLVARRGIQVCVVCDHLAAADAN